jgi:pyridinium-3,5-bisthiocarboxylic acid mononucleotide nickel chelatase
MTDAPKSLARTATPAETAKTQGKLAWFNCFAGIAGDMALGGLLDAGADFDEVIGILRRLPLSNWTLTLEPALRAGLAATRAIVDVTDDVVVRTYSHILGLLQEARLPERVTRRASATFGALAEVEGRLHRRPPAHVHFHEVGSMDAIIDVVGTMAAFEVLGIDTITASPVAVGTGTVRTAHGILPNPSPAVVGLLEGVPTWGRDMNVELTTPTGAAILGANASSFGAMPPMRIAAMGFGAGQRDMDGMPNCTQVVLGDPVAVESQGGAGQDLVVLEANIDDATGEALAHAVSRLIEAGAHDAWLAPVTMKKGRPGHVLSVLADPVLAPELIEVIGLETGSLGVRAVRTERWAAQRRIDEVEVEGIPVRIKVSPGRAKAESRDAAFVARRTGMPLREVIAVAESTWRDRGRKGPESTSPEPPTTA